MWGSYDYGINKTPSLRPRLIRPNLGLLRALGEDPKDTAMVIHARQGRIRKTFGLAHRCKNACRQEIEAEILEYDRRREEVLVEFNSKVFDTPEGPRWCDIHGCIPTIRRSDGTFLSFREHISLFPTGKAWSTTYSDGPAISSRVSQAGKTIMGDEGLGGGGARRVEAEDLPVEEDIAYRERIRDRYKKMTDTSPISVDI